MESSSNDPSSSDSNLPTTSSGSSTLPTESATMTTDEQRPNADDDENLPLVANNQATQGELPLEQQDEEDFRRDKCQIRRTHSSMSADSKPDPPSTIGDEGAAVAVDPESPRGKDVLARKHRHNTSMHISQLDDDSCEFQQHQYFVNVPSAESIQQLGTTREDDEEMTEDMNDDSRRPFSVLLEAVQQVRREHIDNNDDDDEDVDDDDDDQDGETRQGHPDDISSIRSVTASAAESSPPRKHTSDETQDQPPSPPLMHFYEAYASATTGQENGSSHGVRSRNNGTTLLYPGPDSDVALLPRVDEHLSTSQQQQSHPLLRRPPSSMSSFGYSQSQAYANNYSSQSFHSTEQQGIKAPPPPPPNNNGRRKIRLRLQEEIPQPAPSLMSTGKRGGSSILGHLRRRSTRMMMFGSGSQDALAAAAALQEPDPQPFEPDVKTIPRGSVTVSWFDGTSSLELQEHVRKTVVRKLGLDKNGDMFDFRIFDETVRPPEEVLLCPFIPDGSELVLRYTTRDQNDGASTPLSIYSGRAPDSPSAAPSPGRKHVLAGLTVNQLAVLRHQLNNLALPKETPKQSGRKKFDQSLHKPWSEDAKEDSLNRPEEAEEEKKESSDRLDGSSMKSKEKDDQSLRSNRSKLKVQTARDEYNDLDSDDEEEEDDTMVLHSEDPVENGLRQIMEMLIEDRERKGNRRYRRKTDKRQVIFVLANYFVLFLSAIAIFAEIQSHLPGWQAAIEAHMTNVQDCAADKDALFKCVESGDFAGLSASVILYLSRSVATRRFFLLGFDSPQKLWTVVYEALVSSLCWGFSYLFIRRGLNPDTRDRFLHKYWKDCVYGSLAGFNAAFLKAVLKNLIPQEVVEDALRDRQLKIFSWLPSFALHSK